MPAETSRSALMTVLRLMPDAAATALLPPRPSIFEVAPATTLRWRSFRCGRTTSKNRASPSGPTSIPSRYYARPNLRWTLIKLPAYRQASVLADPTRSFGQPIFERGGVRVSDVLDRFLSGDDIHALSLEFGVPEPEIEDVLRATSRRAA